MKALTVWQPWATLIIAGAKPFEFRRWDYRTRDRSLERQRIVIHAGARPIRRAEVQEILLRIRDGSSALLSIAIPIVERALTQPGSFPLSSGLGTAVLYKPRKPHQVLRGVVNDSDRIDHAIWAWPLGDIERWEPPVPARGMQGFWTWPERIAA